MADVLPFLPFPAESRAAEPASPPDAGVRLAALDIQSSFIVEAPAGSGKTGLLIQRYLKLLADQSVTSPEQVLAITFTIKATAEMRDRVLRHLEAARRGSATPTDFDRQTRALALAVLARDQQLEWSLLHQPGRLNIRTIDSVCAEIARTLPVLSGSGGRLTPSENAEPLHRQAARRTLLLLGGGDPVFDDALRNLLLHRDGDLANCESLIADMLALRDQWGDLIPLTGPQLDDAYLDGQVLPRLQSALDHAICATLTQLVQAFPADVLADLAALAAEMAPLDGCDGAPNPLAVCAGLPQPPQAIAAHLDHWRLLIPLLTTKDPDWRRGFNSNHLKFHLGPRHKARLRDLVEQVSHRSDLLLAIQDVIELPPARYPDEQWQIAKSLFRVLSRALVELQLVFAEHSECDFTELSLLARNALTHESGAEDLASALGARLQHLLVDEMQDTSASQYALLQLLTTSWDGHSQTVFLVGDPRQSIYLFRQARVERFIHALHTHQLGDVPLTPLRLTANFRSQRNLVDQFNDDFSRIFPRTSAAEALPYSNASAILPPSPHASGEVWHAEPLDYAAPNDLPSSAELQQTHRRRQAQQIIGIATQWIAKPLPPDRRTTQDELGNDVPEPWRIAVLIRSRSHLAEIVAALHQPGQFAPIPFRAIEIDVLDERQEVLDLTALTRALLHPADRVATLAVLRAPWCGLSLADLHQLAGADDPRLKDHSIQRLIAERGHLLVEESRQRLARVSRVLSESAAQRTLLSAAQLVERAWRSLGGDAWLTPTELANARRFFHLLDEIEASGTRVDLDLLGARLQKLFAEPQTIAAATPCVELLTIHKAKGLEWDVVIVPSLERLPARNPTRLLTWAVIDSSDPAPHSSDRPPDDTPAHIMLAPIHGKGEESRALTRWLNHLHHTRETAEHKRLLYVACTRAREELHLFAAPQLTSKGLLKPRADSLLQAAWPAAERHFADSQNLPGLELAASATINQSPSDPTNNFTNNEIGITLHVTGRVSTSPQPGLLRLPSAFDPATGFAAARSQKLPYGEADRLPGSHQTPFARPEGSFAARSLGNAVHASLEVLARRVAKGQPPAQLLAELPSWIPRISALLRADGLPRTTVSRLAGEARKSLENVLRDPDGLWLLAPHHAAASEFSLTAWPGPGKAEDQTIPGPVSVRADRIFNAGPEPHAPGESSLWIVDYKTSSHDHRTRLEDFLAAQRLAYAPQLETYAHILAPALETSPGQVRLALYFPALPRLIWWKLAPGPDQP